MSELLSVGPALGFFKRLREGLDAGLDLPDAISRGASALPREAREPAQRILRRLEGDYPEDEWGFDEEFAALVEPCSPSSTSAGGACEWRARTTCPAMVARCWWQTTPASCPGTPR